MADPITCADPGCPISVTASGAFCSFHDTPRGGSNNPLDALIEADDRKTLIRDQLGQCSDVEEVKTWLYSYLVGIAQERVS